MNERPTIQQVAEYAGVSIGTVSRVLNSRAGVSQTTRERVRASIQELAFRPDHVARALSKAPCASGSASPAARAG